MDNGQCVRECPSGYVQQQSSCEACPPNCDICNSPSDCQTCHGSFSYYEPNRSCLSRCPDGYYHNNAQTCVMCNSPCSLCSGPAGSDCLDCQQGYAMDTKRGKCERCCSLNARSKSKGFCCDCATDNKKCVRVYANTDANTNQEDSQDGPIKSASSLAITLAVVGVIILIIIVALAIYGGVRVRRSKKARHYSPVASDPLRIMDNDSGSEFEAELFAKT